MDGRKAAVPAADVIGRLAFFPFVFFRLVFKQDDIRPDRHRKGYLGLLRFRADCNEFHRRFIQIGQRKHKHCKAGRQSGRFCFHKRKLFLKDGVRNGPRCENAEPRHGIRQDRVSARQSAVIGFLRPRDERFILITREIESYRVPAAAPMYRTDEQCSSLQHLLTESFAKCGLLSADTFLLRGKLIQ